MVIEDPNPNPSSVRSQLREWEDYNYAMKLQDQEFGVHYDQNRSERRVVGSDTKTSKVVQQNEDEAARALRRKAFRQIEETDEQIAQRLAAEWNAEETRKTEERLRQELMDEQMAKKLAESGEFSADLPGSSHDSYFPSVPAAPTSNMPTQPPSYDFAMSEQQPQRESVLLDLNSPTSSSIPPVPPVPSNLSYQSQSPASNSEIRKGIALPGLATSSTPRSVSPPVTRLPPQLISQPSLDSPVSWPPPPPSVLNPGVQISLNNPFLADLTSTNAFMAPPSVTPPAIGFTQSLTAQPASRPSSIGFQSEFGLPPPSSLALHGLRDPGPR